jgi:REP element-mobilizing transposase RayT
MPRQARIDTPGALHHIIFRGIERRNIFLDDTDRENFLERLGLVLTETGSACYAWTLIPNHVHLLLRTGMTPLSTVMRRLLTGHAAYFNHRHQRCGKLFQNRYKSILCQKDAYLLELVRYIHLNPIRAQIAPDLISLDKWPFCGHSTIIGNHRNPWQAVSYVLGFFGKGGNDARQKYREYVEQGVDQGRRPELTGGGLIRSMGGWSAVKMCKNASVIVKSDERILGDSEFVEKILCTANERYESKYALKAAGYDLAKVARRVCRQTGVAMKQLWSRGKQPETVQARSLLCYWACRELGMKTTELARELKISQPTVSQSVRRGEKLAIARQWKLME